MRGSSIWPQIFAATAASLILVCTGINSVIPITHRLKAGSQSCMDFTNWKNLLLSAIGIICGSLLGLLIVDKVGRRTTLLLMTIPLVTSNVLEFVNSCALLHLSQFIGGISIGVAFMVTPMYIGEIADRRIRGGLCALIPVMFAFGQLISMIMITWVSIAALLIVATVVPIVFATALLWSPESPYYFAMKNLPNKVQESVVWLRGTSDVVQEVQQIRNSTALNQRKCTSFLTLFRVNANRKALFTIIGLFLFKFLATFSGELHYAYWTSTTYYDSRVSLATMNLIKQMLSILTGIYIVFLVDKLGRRPLLLASATLSTMISLVAVLCHMLLVDVSGDEAGWWFSNVISSGYSISISIGLGTLPFVLAGELFSSETKTIALAITVCFDFIARLFIITVLAPVRYSILPALIYIPLVLNIMSVIFVFFAVSETKGRSLSEIQTKFQGHFSRQV